MPKTQYRIERYSDLRPNPPPRAKVTEGPPRLPSSKLRQGSQCHATVTTVWTIISFDLDTERPLHSKLNQPLQRTNFSVARMHSHAKKSLRLLNLDGNLDRSRSLYIIRLSFILYGSALHNGRPGGTSSPLRPICHRSLARIPATPRARRTTHSS